MSGFSDYTNFPLEDYPYNNSRYIEHVEQKFQVVTYSTTVEPRVSWHLRPSKRLPDTRECPDKRDSRKILKYICELIKLEPSQHNHTL